MMYFDVLNARLAFLVLIYLILATQSAGRRSGQNRLDLSLDSLKERKFRCDLNLDIACRF